MEVAAILQAVKEAWMKDGGRGYLGFGDVVEILVDTSLDHMDFHGEGFVVDFGELADEVIAEIEGLAVLFVLW